MAAIAERTLEPLGVQRDLKGLGPTTLWRLDYPGENTSG
jgi:hypothetical protein